MKYCFAKHLQNQIHVAAAVFVATLSFVTGSATAGVQVSFIPNPNLTPYQIVHYTGKCIEATASPSWQAGWIPKLRDCQETRGTQKFYLLDNSSVTDWVPQTDLGWHARIVLASLLNISPGAGYSYLRVDPSDISNIVGTPTSNVPFDLNYGQPWYISRYLDGTPMQVKISNMTTGRLMGLSPLNSETLWMHWVGDETNYLLDASPRLSPHQLSSSGYLSTIA